MYYRSRGSHPRLDGYAHMIPVGVSAEGTLFLRVKAVMEDDESGLGRGQVIYVQNWLAELDSNSTPPRCAYAR